MDLLELSLRGLLERLSDPRREAMLAIYDDHQELFREAKGSSHNHQAWEGGYADHLAETIRVNRWVWPVLNDKRRLPFSMDSADICLFLHDAEKLFRYSYSAHPEVLFWRHKAASTLWEDLKDDIIRAWQHQYGFHLTADEQNAIAYTHGEGPEHRKDWRVATPLAAHVHHCDNTSARIWFDQGAGLG